MIAILGGGISGLAAAYELKKANKEFILLEAGDYLGGKIRSVQEEGYTFELGPNTVLINNKEIKDLLDELELTQEVILPEATAVRNRFVLKNGQIEAIPNSLKTLFQSRLFSFGTLGAILKEPFKKVSKEEESLATFSKRRFGQQIYEDFITPFISGIYAGDPERMHLRSTLKLLKEAEEQHGSVLKGMIKIMKQRKADNEKLQLPKQKIFTFSNGLQELINQLQRNIEGNYQLGSSVIDIDKKELQYKVSYRKNGVEESLTVDGIISCMPAAQLGKVLTQLAPSTSKALMKVHYVPAIITHLAYAREVIGFKQQAFGLLSRQKEKVPFLGVLFNSRFFPHSSPADKELITVISGGYKNPELIGKESSEIAKEIHASLSHLLAISSNPAYIHVHKWEKAIPQYEMGHPAIEKEIQQFEKENTDFLIGGNFYRGISVSDSVRNGINLAKQIA
jgi:oxygen-dependent protoporphyrinogen oxidase